MIPWLKARKPGNEAKKQATDSNAGMLHINIMNVQTASMVSLEGDSRWELVEDQLLVFGL